MSEWSGRRLTTYPLARISPSWDDCHGRGAAALLLLTSSKVGDRSHLRGHFLFILMPQIPYILIEMLEWSVLDYKHHTERWTRPLRPPDNKTLSLSSGSSPPTNDEHPLTSYNTKKWRKLLPIGWEIKLRPHKVARGVQHESRAHQTWRQ